MSLEIKLTIEGLEDVDARLSRLDPLDQNTILNSIGQQIKDQIRERFTTKTAPDGSPWKKNITGTSILVRSGNLAGVMKHVVSGDEVLVGPFGKPRLYAAIHQFGGTITPKSAKALRFQIGNRLIHAKKVTIPARPFLGLSDQNKLDILDALAVYLRDRLK